MSLEMSVRMSNEIAILDLEGRLAFGREGDSLRETILRIFEQGHQRILLNLESVVYADSGGLGEMVAAYAAITRRGGAIKLLKPRGKILGMLRMTHIDALFEICEDEQTAVAGFKPVASTRGTDTLSDFLNN